MLCIMTSGCSDNRNAEYHIYSDGVLLDSGVIAPVKTSTADFYTPEGMETNYYRSCTNALCNLEKPLYCL